jgi:hypothetical protein
LSSTWFRIDENNKRLGSRWGCYLEWHWALLFLCGQKRPLKISVKFCQLQCSISGNNKHKNWLSHTYPFHPVLMWNFSFQGLVETFIQGFPTLSCTSQSPFSDWMRQMKDMYLEMKVMVGTQDVVLLLGYHHDPHPCTYSHCK